MIKSEKNHLSKTQYRAMRHEVLWNWVGVSATAPHRHYVGWCGATTGDAPINWDGLRRIAPYTHT